MRETAIIAVLPADEAYAHESGKNRFNEAIARFVANGDRWELHDALVPMVQNGQLEQTDEALRIELTREVLGGCA